MAKARQEVIQLKGGRFAGKWLAKVILDGYTSSGNPKQKRVICATQKEALEEKRRIEREIARGTFSNDRTSLETYVNSWLEQKKSEVKQRTVESYAQAFRVHLLPHLGKMALGKLKTPQVQVALNSISEAVSASQANRCRRALHACLQDAWRAQLIPLNPVSPVKPKKETAQVKTIWTSEELNHFLHASRFHRLYAAFHLVAATGLRRGELLGLRWTDLEGQTLHVRQQIAPNRGSKRLESPKSQQSNRAVPLDGETMQVLAAWKTIQQEEKHNLGDLWGESPEYGDIIFTTELGTAYIPRNFDAIWNRLKKNSGVPQGMKLHTMRDINGSQLLAEGFSPNEVADRLGHDPTVLLKTYAHTLTARKQAMAKPISERYSTKDSTTLN